MPATVCGLTERPFRTSVRGMRLFVLAIVCAGALAVPALAAAPPTIAKKTPGGTLFAEAAAFNKSDWKSLYTAYTPRYKAHCPYAKWAAAQAKTRQQAGTVTIKISSSKIVGSKAYLAYQLLHGTTVLFAVKASDPDVYLKTGGLWYDEYEPNHGC
jgi:hypothetical protein